MAKYKYILTVIITLCTLITYAQPAQYTPMTASGYQMKRLKVDSTLHLPSFCGVPTLRGSLAKEGALAIDTCGGFLFIWTNENGWDTIGGSGGGSSTDTTSLSNRINLKIDSLKRSNDSVYAYRNGTRVFQFKDSVGGGGGNFWKTSGTTILGGSDTITSSNGILVFGGAEEDMAKFSVQANDIDITTTGGANGLRIIGLNILTDTSEYKPLMIGSGGKIEKSSSWFGGGGGGDTAKVVIAQVHNATATTLLKGEVVYLFGANGNVASVKRANNKQDATSSKTFGLVRKDIPSGANGFITTQGQIEKLNLGSYAEGDVLWLDSIDGQFTKVEPQAPYHAVFIGVVERANNGNGLAYVKPQNGYKLGEIHDVQLTSPINNQVLAYSDTQLVWKNRNITSLIDTTLFQRKSLSANTIMANNTISTANATAQIFKQFGNQTYTDSITFTGATTPSGSTNHSFRYSQIGNLVTLHITLTYATTGSLSQVAIEIPDGLPAPILPTGLTANNDIIAYGTGYMVTNTTGVAGVFSKVFLRHNTGLVNDYEVVINQGANSSYRIFNTTIQYFAQ